MSLRLEQSRNLVNSENYPRPLGATAAAKAVASAAAEEFSAATSPHAIMRKDSISQTSR